MEKIFNKVLQQVKQSILPLAMTSLLFASSSLFAEDSSSDHHHHHHKHHLHYSVSKALMVNPKVDFLLQNANTAITDLYSAFLIPPTATSLSAIIGQYNTYSSPLVFVNPADPRNIIVPYGQDGFSETPDPVTGAQSYGGLSNAGSTLVTSLDGGKTWHPSNAALPTWLGGRLGQTTGGFVYPISFSKSGVIYFGGSYAQTEPLLPIQGAMGGIFVSKSFDGGLHWTDPVILDTTISGAFQIPANGGPAEGIADSGSGSILVDPIHDKTIHTAWSRVNLGENTLYGDIWFSNSFDEGRTWTPAALAYDLLNDPVWLANSFNPNFPLGGQAIGGTLVAVVNDHSSSHKKHKEDEVLLIGFNRFYPKPGATTFTDTPEDSIFDHAVVRSTDGGKSWDKTAVVVAPYNYAFSHDPSTSGSTALIVVDGGLNNTMAVSPLTGRVYYVYQGGNTAISTDPTVNQFFPTILLNSSSNAGKSWSAIAQVSKTPFNLIYPGANQSFNANIAILDNGLVGIIYGDYRNYSGGTINADYWLAIYKETDSPKGGSTKVGLDFVEEIRLTKKSFDASIGYDDASLLGIGSIEGIAARGNEFLTTFGVTNQGNLAPQAGPYGMSQDLNNRENIFFETVTFSKRK